MPQDIYFNDGAGNIRKVPANKVDTFKKYFPKATQADENQLSEIESKRAAQSEKAGNTKIVAPEIKPVNTRIDGGGVSFDKGKPLVDTATDIYNIHKTDPEISFRAKYGAYKQDPALFRDKENDATQTPLPSIADEFYKKNKKSGEMESLQDFLANTQQGRGFVDYDKARQKYFEDLDVQLTQEITNLERKIKEKGTARQQLIDRPVPGTRYGVNPQWLSADERARIEAAKSKDAEEANKIATQDDLNLAAKNLQELKMLQAAVNDRNTNAVAQFFNEAGRRLPKSLYNIGTMGFGEVVEGLDPRKGGELSSRSGGLLNQYASLHQDDRSIAQDIAQGTVGSLEFMAQFAGAGGVVSGLTKNIGKSILTAGAKKAATKGAGKVLKIAGREVSESLLQTAIMPSTIAMAIENNAQNPGSFLDSFANAYLSNLVEVGSERMGQFIPGPKFKLPGSVQKLQKATGIDGMVGEFLEEQIATIGHSALGDGQAEWSDLIDPRQQLITAGVVGVIQLPYASINAGGYAAGKYRNVQQKRSINKAYTQNMEAMNAFFGTDTKPTIMWLNNAIDQAQQSGEGIASIMTSIVNQGDFTEEQTNAILNYGLSYLAKKGLETAKEEQIQNAQAEARQLTEQAVNLETNSIILATVPGMEEPTRIQGNVILREDGSIDAAKSGEIYYTDAEGKRKVIDPKFIEIVENVPAEQVIEELSTMKAAEVVNQQANDEVRPYEPGEVVRFTSDGNVSLLGQIQGADESGNYQVIVDGVPAPVIVEPRMIINEDNLQGVDNGILVDYRDDAGNVFTGTVDDMSIRGHGVIVIDGNEIRSENVIGVHQERENEAPSAIKTSEETPQNEGVATGSVQQNETGTAETGTESQNETAPEQQQAEQAEAEKQEFMQSLPVVESGKNKGQIDQSQMTPEQNIRYFEYQYGQEKAVQAARKMSENLTKRIKKEQEKLDNDPFNIAQNELVEQLQAQMEAYKNYAFARMQEQTEKNIAVQSGPSVTQSKQQRSAGIQQEEAGRTGTAEPTIKEKWDAADKIEGIEDVITLASGEKIPGRYILTTADAPSPSHDIERNFAKTKGFPTNEQGNTVNDRDYEADKTAQTLVQQRASKYDEQAVQNPVVVSRDGIVISGNDRTMAGNIAARNGTDKAYVDYITKYADRWGFTPEMVTSMPAPRIVFVPYVELPYNTATFAKFNAEDKKTQSTLERAIKSSKSVSREIIIPISEVVDGFKSLAEFYADSNATQKVLQVLTRNSIVQPNEIPRLMDGDVFSAEGRSFLETLLLGAVLQEQALREVDAMRSVRQSLMRIMPQLARNASLSEYSVIPELNNAIHLLYQAKRSGSKVKLHLMQTNVFEASPAEVYAEAEKLIAIMLENAKDTEIRNIFESYNKEADTIESGQANMFDGVLSKPALLTLILNKYGQQAEINQQDGSPSQSDGQGKGNRSGHPTGSGSGQQQPKGQQPKGQRSGVNKPQSSPKQTISKGENQQELPDAQQEQPAPQQDGMQEDGASGTERKYSAGQRISIDGVDHEISEAGTYVGTNDHFYTLEKDGQPVYEDISEQELDNLINNVAQSGNIINFVENKQDEPNETNEASQPVSQGIDEAQVEETGRMGEEPRFFQRGFEASIRDAQAIKGTLSEREVADIAESTAKENGRWIPLVEQTQLGEPFPSGMENEVYHNERENAVYKVNNLSLHKNNILSLIERINHHNQLFPDTEYELYGFSGFGNGSVYPILKQKHIPNATFATPQEIDDYMSALGFEPTGKEAEYTNGEFIVSDLRSRNVLKDSDGDLYVIDAGVEKQAAKQRKAFSEYKENKPEIPKWDGKESVADYAQKVVDADKVRKESKTKSIAEKSDKVEKIEDFGEKIGGARKDLAQEYKTKLSEIKEDDIRSKPLSKIFPRLDLKKLVENGDLTQDDALYLNYRYDKIPTKPRDTGGLYQKRKLDNWINDVQKEIKLAHTILSQVKSFGHLDLLKKIKLQENAGYRYFQNGDEIKVTPEQRLMLNDDWMHIETLKALGFPTSGIKMGNAKLQYRVHSGEQYIVTVNNKRAFHKTFEEAVDYLKKELEKPTERETVFNIYQNRKSGKYFIGKPIQGKEPVQLSEFFDTDKEVISYFRDHRDEVQAKWDAMSVKPEERRSENRERQGRDWRNGKDVTPEQFQSEFGFRGTEFGNWVNQQERQDALNNAYDALMDLSSVLDISPRSLSLNGELGMAFGARGTGNAGGSTAAAHYESAKVVINLTKKSGAGSLAHEWWHALDNYFARMGKKSLDFATDGTKVLDANVREEMKQAFTDIVDAIKKSELPKRSGELDKTRSKPYWATNVEMSARSFENYVIKALSEKGDSNDYLANFKELSDWTTVGSFEADSYPYPTQEESHYINEKFQQFFDTIQEKIDKETGNTILFRKVDESGFYSTVEDALEKIKQEKGTPEQFKAMLLKNGAKQAELDWMDYDGTFTGKSVTKTEIQDWIDQNRIEVKEVDKGSIGRRPMNVVPNEYHSFDVVDTETGEEYLSNVSEARAYDFIGNNENNATDTKYSKYQLPGGENYKELLLTMPAKEINLEPITELSNEFEYIKDGDKWGVIPVNQVHARPMNGLYSTKKEALEQALNQINFYNKSKLEKEQDRNQFKSSHFDEPNILAHVRFNDREVNGERVLFIEEIQSDWAQQGKKKGFNGLKELPEEYEITSAFRKFYVVKKGNDTGYIASGETIEEATKNAINKLSEEAVPNMPFKKTDQWVNLALRRMMMYAAENDYDRIAWTTGQQQADRYDLSKTIEYIEYFQREDGTYELSMPIEFPMPYNMREAELEEYFGKEIASKITNGEGEVVSEALNQKKLSGVDLKVGGEGMIAFYDRIVPKAAKKLSKPFGANVETVEIPEIGQQQSIPVTDALREIAPDGMPLFRKRDTEAREAYAMREWNRAKRAIDELAAKMGVSVEIIETTDGLPKAKAEAKGWYDTKSKKIAIVMPNHSNSWDAQATFLHEAVGHHGLRELFGEHFDTFLDNVYNNAEEEVKAQIDKKAQDKGWAVRKATEEYLSELAEDQEILQSDRLSGFFNSVKKFFFDMLAKIGFNPGFKLSNNELKYILWRSYQNLAEPGRYRSVVDQAKDVAMQYGLKVGNYEEKTPMANVAEEPGSGLPAAITVDGVERSTTNSDGRPIASSEEGIRNFWRWFGDSKVVDKQGRPLVVYHGTPTGKAFNIFNPSSPHIRKSTVPEGSIVFTPDIMTAGNYMRNPSSDGNKDGKIFHAYLKAENPIDITEEIAKLRKKKIAYTDAKKEALKMFDRTRHDGIIIRGNNPEISVFTPNQIKSATGNVGTFDPGNDDIRYRSVSDAADEIGSKMPEDIRNEYDVKYNQFFTRFREAWEDTYLPVKNFLDLLRNNNVEISDYNDFYKQATHLQGKNDAQLKIFKDMYQHPITIAINALENKGFKYRDIENYVFAKHGLERNEFMRNAAIEEWDNNHPDAIDEERQAFIDSLPNDYAGITALESEFGTTAQEYIDDFEERAGGVPVGNLWTAINNATKWTLTKQYKTGMMSKDTYDELTGRYQYYVPLRGHDKETAEDRWDYTPDMGTYFTAPLLKAEGRRSRAESPFAYVAQMAHSAIAQGNKNTLKQSILRLAQKDNGGLMSATKTWKVNIGTADNPIWEQQSAPYSEDVDTYLDNQRIFEERMQELKNDGMAYQGRTRLNIGDLFIKPRQAEQHEIQVYQNGISHTVYINANPAIARAINGANRKDVSQNLGFIANVTRSMAANFTTRNPLFIMTNFSRDYIFSSTMLLAKETPKFAGQFQMNIPKALGALQRYERGKVNLNNKPDRYLYEYLINGGKTGFSHIFELDRVAKSLEREAKKGGSKNLKDHGIAVLNVIDTFNEIAENTTRLSAYITSRENGRNITDSVSDAKNITVNFNQKGAGSSVGKNSFEQFIFSSAGWVRPLYLFTNAAVQALSNVLKVTAKHPVKMASIIASYSLLGFISPLLAQLFGGDDGEEAYLKLTDWERQNNWCILLPNGSFLKIPLPHELRVFHRLGDNIYQSISGKQDVFQTLLDTMFSIADLLPMNPMGAAKTSWAELVPDAIRPFAQLITNTNFMGSRVYNEWANKNMPGYLKARTNKKGEYYAPNFMVDWFMYIDHITGGDSVKKGVISLNPDIANHLLRGYFGGLYTLAEQGVGIASETYNLTQTGEFNMKIRETPLKTFYADKNDLRIESSGLSSKYYEVSDKVSEARRRDKAYFEKVKSGEMAVDEYARRTQELNMENVNNLYDRIREIRKIEQGLKEMDPDQQKEAERMIFNLKKEVVDMNNLH